MVASLLNNMDKVTQATTASINSNGSAAAEQAKYLNTTASKVKQLQVSLQELSDTTIKTDFLKGIVDGANSAVKGLNSLIKTVGGLPVAFSAGGAALLAFNNKMKVFTLNKNKDGDFLNTKGFTSNIKVFDTGFNEIKVKYKNLIDSFKQGNEAMNPSILQKTRYMFQALGSDVAGLRIKEIALTATTEIMNATLGALAGLGIGLAINAIISGVTHLINKNKELHDSVIQLQQDTQSDISSNNQNISTLSSLSKEYDDLRNKTSLTTAEKQKFRDIESQIASILPESVKGYDSEGNAILDNTKSMKDYIKVLQEKNRIANQKVIDNAGNIFKDYQNQASKAKGHVDDIKEQIRSEKDLRQQLIDQNKYLDKNSAEYKGNAGTIKLYNSKIQDLQNKLRSAKAQMDVTKSSFNQLTNAMKSNAGLSTKQSDLFDKMFGKIDVSKFQSVDEVKAKIQNLIKVVKDPSLKKQIDDLNKISMDKSGKSADKFNDKVQDIYKTLKKLDSGLSLNDVTKAFKSMSNSADKASNSVFNITKSTKQYKDAEANLVQQVKEAKSVISTVNGVLANYHKTKKMDLSTILQLANNGYPQLLKKLNDNKALEKELIKIEKDKAISTAESVTSQIKSEQQYVNQLAAMYKMDTTNFAKVQNAKDNALSQAVQQRINMYKQEMQAALAAGAAAQEAGNAEEATRQTTIYFRNAAAMKKLKTSEDKKALDAESKRLADLKKLQNSLNTSTKTVGVNADTSGIKSSNYGSSGGSGSSKKKKKSTKKKKTYETNLANEYGYDAQIDAANKKLQKQSDLIDNIKDKASYYESAGDYTNAIAQQNKELAAQVKYIKMLESQNKSYNSTEKTIEKKLKSNSSFLKGKNLNNMTEAQFEKLYDEKYAKPTHFKNAAEEKAFKEKAANYKKLVDQLFKIKDANDDITKSIKEQKQAEKELNDEIMENKYDKITTDASNKIDALDDKLNKLQRVADQLSDSDIAGHADNYKSQESDITQEIKDEEAAITKINKTHADAVKAKKNDAAETAKYNESLKDAKANLEEYQEALEDTVRAELQYYYEQKEQQEKDTLAKNTFDMGESTYKSYQQSEIQKYQAQIDAIKASGDTSQAAQDEMKALKMKIDDVTNATYDSIKSDEDWQQAFEDVHQANIDAIDAQIQALEDQADAEDKVNEGIEKQNNLIKLNQELADIANNKNQQSLVKNADGSYQFQYTYDVDAYNDAYDSLQDAQKDYDKWVEDNNRQTQIDELNKQKQYEQDLLDETNNTYSKQYSAIEKSYEDMNGLVDAELVKLQKTVGTDWANIAQAVNDMMATISAAQASAEASAAAAASNAGKTETGKNVGAFENLPDNAMKGVSNVPALETYPTTKPNLSDSQLADLFSKGDALFNSIPAHANGTLSAPGGLSKVDEKGIEMRILGKKDGIATADITSNINQLGENAPKILEQQTQLMNLSSLINAARIPSATSTVSNTNNSPSISIGKLEFPNITDSSKVSDIQDAIIGLTNRTKQFIHSYNK